MIIQVCFHCDQKGVFKIKEAEGWRTEWTTVTELDFRQTTKCIGNEVRYKLCTKCQVEMQGIIKRLEELTKRTTAAGLVC